MFAFIVVKDGKDQIWMNVRDVEIYILQEMMIVVYVKTVLNIKCQRNKKLHLSVNHSFSSNINNKIGEWKPKTLKPWLPESGKEGFFLGM